MKQLIFSVSAMIIVLFFCMPILTMGDRTTRTRKLDDAAASVTEQVLIESMKSADSAKLSDEDIGEAVSEGIKKRLGESGDLSVTVKKCDLKNGLLSISAVETFKNPGKREDAIETEKTCILEQEEHRLLIPVTFYLPEYTPEPSSTYTIGYERLYRYCEVLAGDEIRLPEDLPDIFIPTGRDTLQHLCFDHWMLLINGKEVDYDERKDKKAGSSLLSADGSLYGGIVFVAAYKNK